GIRPGRISRGCSADTVTARHLAIGFSAWSTPYIYGEPCRLRYDSPAISPFSSRSIRAAAGFADRPGIVRMSPQIGYTNPAPTEARTSRTGNVHPVGAPLSA